MTGLYDDTLIIFTSDNGGDVWGEGKAYNGRLSGGKSKMWEGGIRVPSFIKGTKAAPFNLPAGTTVNGLFDMTDWLPTLAHAMGASNTINIPMNEVWKCASCEPHRSKTLDGKNQWPLFKGGPSSREWIPHSVVPRALLNITSVVELKAVLDRSTYDLDLYGELRDASSKKKTRQGNQQKSLQYSFERSKKSWRGLRSV